MTCGESMEIARKYATSVNMRWKAPVVIGSNHMPKYINTGNNVGRRLVTFRFDKVVSNPQYNLQQELNQILFYLKNQCV